MKRIAAIEQRQETSLDNALKLIYFVRFDGEATARWVLLEDLVAQCGFDHAADMVYKYDTEHDVVARPDRVIGKRKCCGALRAFSFSLCVLALPRL